MIRVDLSAVWREHLDCEPGEHRWIALPGEQPPAVLGEALGECGMCDEGCDVYHCCVGNFGGSVTNWDHLCSRHFHHQGFHDCDGCCPACDDGRPLVELTAPCPHDCERFGGQLPGHVRGSNWAWVPCYCDGTGRVSAGVWVVDMPDDIIQPLPVTLDGGPGPYVAQGFDPSDACAFIPPVGRAEDIEVFMLPSSADRRGEWAVRLRRIR